MHVKMTPFEKNNLRIYTLNLEILLDKVNMFRTQAINFCTKVMQLVIIL